MACSLQFPVALLVYISAATLNEDSERAHVNRMQSHCSNLPANYA